VLYGCEACSPIFGNGWGRGRENHMPKVFDSRVLRKIFGPTRDVVRGEWRRIHNQQLYDLYSSTNTIQVMKSRWA
jgi:hypothetical protein